jgi:sugar-phosphatase
VRTRALLIDLDGTLVDSTAAVARCWTRMADRLGLDPATIVGRYHGIPARSTLPLIDPTLSEAEVERLSNELLADEVRDTEGVVALPGAAALVAALPDRAWAIVTSCSPELALARLAAAELPVPPVLVTADDVRRGKPDPEPYLLGAERLGLVPADCLVLEDAPAGVESARAAGCPVLGVRTTHPELDAPTVPDLSAISVVVAADGLRLDWSG